MLSFISLGSGSCGNCYYLFTEDFGLLIDVGIGVRKVKKYFREYGFTLNKVKAVLLTHDHTDHVKGAGPFSNEFRIPVYATNAVFASMTRNRFLGKKVYREDQRVFDCGTTFGLGPFTVSAFRVPHDSADNCGYFIDFQGTTFCIMTDAGSITEEMARFIPLSDYLVVEANYDAAMLAGGKYPVFLQKRISSGRGHMCNADTAAALASYLGERTKHVWLCHLSEDNNRPELARETVAAALSAAGNRLHPDFALDVLRRRVPSPLYELI